MATRRATTTTHGKPAHGALAWRRWRLAVPPEKGGWIWWVGPLVVGAMAAPAFSPSQCLVAVGACAGFCLRQPLTVLARQRRRGAARRDSRPALVWVALYSALLLGVATALVTVGHARVILLAGLALPVLAWHLRLTLGGDTRRHWALDLGAAGALALAAPAAYWAGGGSGIPQTLAVWALPAAQSSASIVHMFTRLDQRALRRLPALSERLKAGATPMAAHLLAFALAVGFWQIGGAGWVVLPAMLVPLLEGAWSVLRPQFGHSPMRIGLRQLAVSAAAMLLLSLGLAEIVGHAP